MNYIILIFVGVVGILLGATLIIPLIRANKGYKGNEKRWQGSIENARKARQEQKEKKKQKILDLFKEREQITNDDVEELLVVSDTTATNYLQELEQEQKIIQHGEIGRGVYYTLKKRQK